MPYRAAPANTNTCSVISATTTGSAPNPKAPTVSRYEADIVPRISIGTSSLIVAGAIEMINPRTTARFLGSSSCTPTCQWLSERVGLSHSPCWHRLKRLEFDGGIHGRAVLLDPAASGPTANVFAQLKLR